MRDVQVYFEHFLDESNKADEVFLGNFGFFVLAATYFPPCGVSSALRGLTALFGMRRGVTLAPNHQDRKSKKLQFFE